jgi:hypothetical protein
MCINTIGSFVCSAYIVDGSVRIPAGEPFTSLSPIVLASTMPGMKLQFNLTLRNQVNVSTIVASAGVAGDLWRYPCTSLTVDSLPSPGQATVTCVLPAGCGTNLRLSLTTQSGLVTHIGNGTHSFLLQNLSDFFAFG